MVKLTPLIRLLLIGVAAAVAAVPQAFEIVPEWLKVLLAAAGTILAGLGIIPPQVPTQVVVTDTEPTHGLARASNPAGNPNVGEPRAGGRPGGRQGGYADSGLLLVLLVIFVVILAGGFFASKLLWLLLLVVLLVALLG